MHQIIINFNWLLDPTDNVQFELDVDRQRDQQPVIAISPISIKFGLKTAVLH